jgi:hypothetical protein
MISWQLGFNICFLTHNLYSPCIHRLSHTSLTPLCTRTALRAGLGGPFDPSMSKALYSLSDAPEFLFDEERQQKKRSWSENITFLTGVGYLGGTVAGGGLGVYHGGALQVESS